VGLGLFYEIPRTYSDTPHSVGISEQVISSTQRPLSHNTQHSQKKNFHAVDPHAQLNQQ